MSHHQMQKWNTMATDLITHIALCLETQLETLNKFIVLLKREKKE